MLLRSTSRAAVVACASLALYAVAPTAAGAAATGASTLTLSTKSGAGKSLRTAGVKVQAVRPATAKGSTLTLPTAGVTLGASPSVRHAGAVRFAKGKRKITFTSLRTSLGTAPAITGAVGGTRVTLFTLRGGSVPTLDASTGSAATTGAGLTLTTAAAQRVKSALKLRRLTGGALGRATVMGTDTLAGTAPKTKQPAATTPAGAAAQASAPGTTAPGATPPPTTKPFTPPADLPEPTTPALDVTTWTSSALPADGSHRSFIGYVLNPLWSRTCSTGITPYAAVAPSGGIKRAAAPADPAYDFVVDQTASTPSTLTHRGRVRYTMTCHGIDQWVENLRFTDLDDPTTGHVYADGSHGDRNDPDAPDVAYTGEHLLNLDLAGATVTTAVDGTKRFTNVKGIVAAGAQDELGPEYPAGTPWGVFTFSVAPTARP